MTIWKQEKKGFVHSFIIRRYQICGTAAYAALLAFISVLAISLQNDLGDSCPGGLLLIYSSHQWRTEHLTQG